MYGSFNINSNKISSWKKTFVTTAPLTEAINNGIKVYLLRSINSTSTAKTIAAIGVWKIAEIAPVAPHANSKVTSL